MSVLSSILRNHDLSSLAKKDEATQVFLINEFEKGEWSWSGDLYGPAYYFKGDNKLVFPSGAIDIVSKHDQEEKLTDQLTKLKKKLKTEIKKEKHAGTPDDRIEAAKTITELQTKVHELIQAKSDEEAEQKSRKIAEKCQKAIEKTKAQIQEQCSAALKKVDKKRDRSEKWAIMKLWYRVFPC